MSSAGLACRQRVGFCLDGRCGFWCLVYVSAAECFSPLPTFFLDIFWDGLLLLVVICDSCLFVFSLSFSLFFSFSFYFLFFFYLHFSDILLFRFCDELRDQLMAGFQDETHD
jgi:hypothetical protein